MEKKVGKKKLEIFISWKEEYLKTEDRNNGKESWKKERK